METHEMRPSTVLYSQSSISNTFQNGNKIGNVLNRILNDEMPVSSIPMIRVKQLADGSYLSVDNRRLWMFKQLEDHGKLTYITAERTDWVPEYKRMHQSLDIDIRGDVDLADDGSSYEHYNECSEEENSSGSEEENDDESYDKTANELDEEADDENSNESANESIEDEEDQDDESNESGNESIEDEEDQDETDDETNEEDLNESEEVYADQSSEDSDENDEDGYDENDSVSESDEEDPEEPDDESDEDSDDSN